MSSALSITRAVNPPRAAFVDYPLGHTTGMPHQPTLQRDLLLAALHTFETISAPGGVVTLPYEWEDGGAWKESLIHPRESSDSAGNDGGGGRADERTSRHDTPQYQSQQDRERAEAALAAGGCKTCVFLS